MAQHIRYLVQRDSGFYARLAVPHTLRPIVGKKELWAALHATNRADAIRKLPAAVARLQSQIEGARTTAAAAPAQRKRLREGQALSTRQIASDFYASELLLDEADRGAYPDHDPKIFELQAARKALLTKVASGRFSNEEAGAAIGWAIDDYRGRGHTDIAPGSGEWRDLAKALAGIQLETLKRISEREQGDFGGKPTHPLLAKIELPPGDPLNGRMLGPESSKPLCELLPSYLAERGAKERTDYDSRITVRMFEEFIEEPRPVYKITRADLNGFKRALSETPANYSKRFQNMKLPDAIKANKKRTSPFPLLNPKTINDKYLSKLHSIFNWCLKNDIIPDNPAAGIKVDSVRGNSQPPVVNFSPGDLTLLFNPQAFDVSTRFGEFQWAMLMALFTGTRASELAQLKLDSVRHERDILVLVVEEETKNIGSRRIVPVHSTLIAHGIERRIADLRSKGEAHFFPQWYQKGIEAKLQASNGNKATLNVYFPRFIPKRFNDTYLPRVGIHDSRKKWHSFRHTFKTGLARAGVPRSMQDDLCGHADRSAGAGYVHGESVEAMKDAIEKLRFDGLELAS